MKKVLYKCNHCGKKVETFKEKSIKCCGKSMELIPMKQCEQPHSAEYSGPFEENEPCDNGRAGKRL